MRFGGTPRAALGLLRETRWVEVMLVRVTMRRSRRWRLLLTAVASVSLTVGVAGPSVADTGLFAEFPVPGASERAQLAGVAAGSDGNVWFTDIANNQVGRITPAGTVTEFGTSGFPTSIAVGPDGNLWFIDQGAKSIGRITTSGSVTEFSLPPNGITVTTADPIPSGIVEGPDGDMWFVDIANNAIGQITPTGTINEHTIPTAHSFPAGIAAGADGNLWFTEEQTNKIGQITPTGTITEFNIPTASNTFPFAITNGPDGNLWFTEQGANAIGRIAPNGTITEFPIPTADSQPAGITRGPDGNLWFTEQNMNVNQIGRIAPGGDITEVKIPAGVQPTGIAPGPDGNLWFAILGPLIETGGPGPGLIASLNPTLAPRSILPPSITGTAQQAELLSESHGGWSENPASYAYQWEACDRSGNACLPIPGATGQTYLLKNSDIGHTIRVQEQATNVVGASAAATSAATGAVTAEPAPSNTSPPSITGTAQPAHTLSESHGGWSENPTSYGFQWEACDRSGNACVPIPGATGQTYLLKNGDIGHTIRVQEQATNLGGTSAPAASTQTGLVTASQRAVLAALVSSIVPRGKHATIAAILKADGFALVLKAVETGRASVSWYQATKSPRAAAKGVLVAVGRRIFTRPGTARVKMILTPAGRRLLEHSTNVKLVAKGAFTASVGATTIATKVFTLKR